ncbi:YSIRK-type signal peptide-containing protein [Staphylococcus simulans]|uniref:YSIRK-type signal peptide-containing protein n=1 Tax=Staphylococcus simulans TaxID=1286 RepID=UPI0021D0DA51|nr:YSIRK-type signal peptide-containing protein [Staphylococcus simulans]UXR47921.1 YSIRK-type signal peptide-containing protein [Staphylococcus simulans]
MKKKQLFSLRKLTVGIASVSLGTVVFLSGAQAVDAQANAQDATTITQNAYNVVNNLPNISDKTKDAYIAKITAAAGNNKLTDVEGIVNSAKAEDAQVATAKKVAAEQDAKAVNQQVELAKKVAIETAKKDHAQKIANAKAEIYKLENLSNFTKARYSAKITKAATDEIAGLVQNAKAEDAKIATAKNAGKEQAKADAAAKDKAVKALNQKTADAYQVINSLKNITDKQQLSFLHQVEVDSGTNNGERIDAIVADAKQLDAQFAYDKEQKAKAEQKAARELNTLTQVAYNTVNGLHNLTDQQKDAFNKQILQDSGNNNGHNINNIVANAKALDEQNGNAKHAREAGASTVEQKDKAVRELNTLTSVAYNTVNNLPNLTDAQKDDFNHQILVDSGNNNGQKINDIVAAAKQKDAESAQAKHVREAAANTNLPADVAKKVKAAHNTVEALKNLKPEQKAAAHRKLNEVARTDAKAIDTVVAQAKELNANQAPGNNERAKQKIETAQKAHAQRIANAQAEVNRLKNVSKNTKAEYNEKISRAATDEIPALVKEVKALDAAKQPAIAKKEIAAAQKAHAEQIKESQALVNKLENLSKEAKDEYNSRIAKAATNEVEAIVNEAQAEDTHAATAKKEITAAKNAHEAEIAQAQAVAKQKIETAQKAHAQLLADAQALVNNLENLSKEAKDEYNSRIAKAATDEVEAIVNEAQAEDTHAATAKKEITTAQKAHAKQIADAQALVNKLDKLSKDAKASYNQQIAQAATDEVAAIVQKAQAENAKQAPVNKEVKPAQKATTTPGQANKAGQTTTAQNNGKVVTGQKAAQKAGQTTATTNKAAAQQKAKDAKKQLPATGEQDQVLFGLLSGSLFASAGTLFLLNARRRKENE